MTPNILIVGDSMIDRYWFGAVERMSPEAPVPVVLMQRQEDRPGGAANVARGVQLLGGQATLLSVIGGDEDGSTMSGMCQGLAGFLTIMDYDIRQTVKVRVIDKGKQLARIDFEDFVSKRVQQELLEAFKSLLQHEDFDLILLSDYCKGALNNCRPFIEAASDAGIRVLVDPKRRYFDGYEGAWLLKPNETELVRAIGQWRDEDDFRERAERIRQQLCLTHLLVTRGDRGMTLFSAAGEESEPCWKDYPAEAREVFDVCGAGDTVLATLAVMIGKGMTLDESIRKANRAAGIVVGKFGTAAVTAAELEMADDQTV